MEKTTCLTIEDEEESSNGDLFKSLAHLLQNPQNQPKKT